MMTATRPTAAQAGVGGRDVGGVGAVSREWKPGDVALVRNRFGVWNVAICTVHPDGFQWRYGVALDEEWVGMQEARPLVVIDPDDREQVERLNLALMDDDAGTYAPGRIATALRSLLKQPEPRRTIADVIAEMGDRQLGPAMLDQLSVISAQLETLIDQQVKLRSALTASKGRGRRG